jgi:cysteine desulfurase
MKGIVAQTFLMALDLAGIAVSAGSACSSGKLAPSPVLLAMGETDLAGSALRISFGWRTDEAEVRDFIAGFMPVAHRLRAEHRAA